MIYRGGFSHILEAPWGVQLPSFKNAALYATIGYLWGGSVYTLLV